jgi:hypothetical protein
MCILGALNGQSKKKKCPVGTESPKRQLPESTEVVEKYEALRAAGFGQALPLESRSGLALLLRRGMWAWAKALNSRVAVQQQACVPALRSTAPRQHSVAIQIIAAMAMRANPRRAP